MTREEIIKEIEAFANDALSKTEICLALDLMPHEINFYDDYLEAYNRGQLTTVTKHKEKVIQLANQGSGPAQTMLEQILKNNKLDEIRNAWT